jgi:hypothetical protein
MPWARLPPPPTLLEIEKPFKTERRRTVTRKLLALAFLLGITLVGAWVPPALALPPNCTQVCSFRPPSYPCTCPDNHTVTTCGTWIDSCS